MSVAAKRKEKSIEGFDEGKLAELTEPIRVTVHKNQQGRPMPIVLPTLQGEPGPGTGYSVEHVRQLNEFLPNEWSGGGAYVCKAIGDNGVEMSWQAYFPVDKYPEKIPPTMIDAASPAAIAASGQSTVIPLPTPQQSAPNPMGYPSLLSQAASYYPQVPQMARTPLPPFPGNGFATQYGVQPGAWSGFPAGGYQSPEVEIRKEREERFKMEARMERRELENTYKERQAAMEQEMRRLQEAIQGASSRPAENDQIAALKAEVERERQERAQEKQQNQFQQQLLEMQRQNDLRAAEQDRRMEALMAKLADNKPAGPDPTMMMFFEMQKLQSQQQTEAIKANAEAQKEIARMQAEAQREAARTAIGPREIMEIVGKTSGNQEQSINAMGRAWEFMQNAMEVAMQAQNGGQVHPAVEMIGQGLQGGLALAQRYIEMKGQGQTTQARAAVAIETARAQAAAQAHVATHQQQLDGATNEETDEEGDDEEAKAAEILKAEQDLFGPALESVQRMRVGVESGVLPPDGAANALLIGIDQAGKSGLKIPAFDLWIKHEWSKLVDILIPDAVTSYKEQMLQAMHDQVEAQKTAARNPGVS